MGFGERMFSHNFEMLIFQFPIDSYHDTEAGTVYLYLSTTLHLTNALNIYSKTKTDEDGIRDDFASQLEDREYQLIKALLFMFHTCHIINVRFCDQINNSHHGSLLQLIGALISGFQDC
jgi:hypothetical protein